MGGEPTVDPDFLTCVDFCKENILSKNSDSRIFIATNGISSKIQSIEFNPQIYVLFSVHMEQIFEHKELLSKILNNIQIIKDKDFNIKVNLLVPPDKKYREFIKDVWTQISSITENIHSHFIYINDELLDYSDDFYQDLSFLENAPYYYIFEDENGNKVRKNDFEIFNEHLNKFKNWKCYNNNYEIKIFERPAVSKICEDNYVDLLQHPFYFRNIRKIQPMTCYKDFCNSDGVLKCYKER